jgi:hypothetical protein
MDDEKMTFAEERETVFRVMVCATNISGNDDLGRDEIMDAVDSAFDARETPTLGAWLTKAGEKLGFNAETIAEALAIWTVEKANGGDEEDEGEHPQVPFAVEFHMKSGKTIGHFLNFCGNCINPRLILRKFSEQLATERYIIYTDDTVALTLKCEDVAGVSVVGNIAEKRKPKSDPDFVKSVHVE